nr:poly-beta-1,6-N-acetyl-D-glucosamine synthase [Salinisphaera sp. LB1]
MSGLVFGLAFNYPLFMAWIWIIGGVFYYARRERGRRHCHHEPPEVPGYPLASVLIPCMNEEDRIEETVRYALASRYPTLEVIVVNDGSTDRTGELLDAYADREPRVRVIHLASNQGKAIGLRAAALAARSDYLVCIDGDAYLHPHAVQWLVYHLVTGTRVGAVTGNPRIINRSTLLGKIQVGEFSSIIGLVKRAQRVYGRLFTVSGVIAAFNRAALHRIGFWDERMATDDIDVSWRLQIDHSEVRFEANALCYIFMPETLRGLWKQRLRWAQGGVEVLIEQGLRLFRWRQRRFWGVAIEYLVSVFWSYAMLTVFILFFIGLVIDLPARWQVQTLMPQWHGAVLGMTFLIQSLVSLWMDRRYERESFLGIYYWIIWYPLVYWMLSMFTIIVAVPKTLLAHGRNRRATWVSPDRGVG